MVRLKDYMARGRVVLGKQRSIPVVAAAKSQRQTVTLPAPPSANRYWRNVKGRMVKSKEARAYAGNIWTMMAGRFTAANYPVAVEIRWARRKRMGDLDNRLKVVLDALRGRAWLDDKQIEELHAYRTDGGDDTVTVTWWPAGGNHG